MELIHREILEIFRNMLADLRAVPTDSLLRLVAAQDPEDPKNLHLQSLITEAQCFVSDVEDVNDPRRRDLCG